MKLIKENELNQISGAAISYMGQTIYVDTTGIPSRCVGEIEGMMNAVLRAAESPNFTASSMMYTMGPYMDQMVVSGCGDYLDLYGARVNAMGVAYA